jgi:hypothetical protein
VIDATTVSILLDQPLVGGCGSMPIGRLDLGGVHAGCTEVIGGWVVAAHPLCSVTSCCIFAPSSEERTGCWVWGR